jgi:hypothetical protein
MREPRQRHIPLNIGDRRELDQRKRDYEDATGDVGDWGKFLRAVSLAGLAALGVYSGARVSRLTATVWQVSCADCRTRFPVRVANPPPWRLANATCPNCSRELVVDFAELGGAVGSGAEDTADSLYTIDCHYCQQPIRSASAGIGARGVAYLECPNCGRAAHQ